jgi:APA family basic amino acid/polyamine antiporter
VTNAQEGAPDLVRGLSAVDGALLTVGSVIGTGIFLTTGDIARELPHPGLVLLVWVAAGLFVLAGALTYAELGAMFPRAGGIYHFLGEAYGRPVGFLYGWACFLVIMSGGIAAIAVGFGIWLGALVPLFSAERVWVRLPGLLAVNGAQVAGVLAIMALTAVNHVGLRSGAAAQNFLTVLKVGAVLAFAILALLVPARAPLELTAPVPAGATAAAFGVAMVAALWTYDGWYALTFSAGEVKDPGRNLPLGLVLGTACVVVLYAGINVAYLRALPIEEVARSARIGEDAATALFGPGRIVSAVVALSSFGCLAATILYSSRIYLPMARDGLFFRAVAEVHPRWRTPVRSLWLQSLWALGLLLTGTYEQLYTWIVFVGVLFHAATGAAVFVLRAKRPELPRPYRTWGYPIVPAVFVLGSIALVVNTFTERPRESVLGLLCVGAGLPAYAYWKARAAATAA